LRVNSARVASAHGQRCFSPADASWIRQPPDAKADVLISDGKIAAVGADAANQAPREVERMDVSASWFFR